MDENQKPPSHFRPIPYLPASSKGGRPSIDWVTLRKHWDTDTEFPSLELFLLSYNILSDKIMTKRNTRGWPKANPNFQAVKLAASADVTYVPNDYENEVKKVWDMIRHWRSVQCKSDYLIAEKLKELIETGIDILLDKAREGKDIRSYEILNLMNALQGVQRIQRLSLGMSTENVGVEDPRKLAEQQAGDGSTEDDLPTFEVAVNESGKFKRLRPMRVK